MRLATKRKQFHKEVEQNQATLEYIKSLEERIEEDRQLKQKYRSQITSLRQQLKKRKEREGTHMELIEKHRTDKHVLQKKLESKDNYRPKDTRYVVYIRHAGRDIKIGTYKDKKEAQRAEKQALNALQGA